MCVSSSPVAFPQKQSCEVLTDWMALYRKCLLTPGLDFQPRDAKGRLDWRLLKEGNTPGLFGRIC